MLLNCYNNGAIGISGFVSHSRLALFYSFYKLEEIVGLWK